ncbi:hypothetical protein [Streptantibioticus parmotrematis]|uniref:hypothetical protein n=1 Tax=Streptantibioticus parmotrematis TaxID=2873249 RepID=UPI00207BFD08|nr:hypothetical protein [Streptantibioticus parmotrematis]
MAATEYEDAAAAIVRVAQCTIVNAKWHLCQEWAIARLAKHRGLACVALFPDHPVVQLIAYNGQLLGRARWHRTGTTARWIATQEPIAHEIGNYRSLHGAARALAQAAGMPHRVVTCLPDQAWE